MANYHQNQSYHQESAPTEQLYQNYGISPAYDQQRRAPDPHPTSEEYLRQPATAPAYPTLPPLQHQQPHQQQPVPTTHIHVQPAPVHVSQRPPRIVYVRQQEDYEPHCCLGLCCVCAECVASIVGYVLAILAIAAGLGLAVYFLKYYEH